PRSSPCTLCLHGTARQAGRGRAPFAGLFEIVKRIISLLAATAAIVLAVLLPGCSSLTYYWQGAAGQFDLWWRAQPIDEVIADPSTDTLLKQKLELVRGIRQFASRDLALPDNGSYRFYADVKRPCV